MVPMVQNKERMLIWLYYIIHSRGRFHVHSLIIAFSMYSKIPMPQVEWNDKNMRFSLCFFPLVGAVVGLISVGWIKICEAADVGITARTCILAAVPLAVTGGIHADGFADTMDAVHSWQDKDRKLEILKDSHVGAFAVIMLILYYLILAASLSEIVFSERGICIAYAIAFAYSRTLAGTALVYGKSARKEGIAWSFAKAGSLRAVRIIMVLWVLACEAVFVYIDLLLGAIFAVMGLILTVYFLVSTEKEFGGLTGDLCGCFIMMTELASVILLWIFQIIR